MEATTLEQGENIAKPQRKFFFSTENAKHYHALALEARKKAKAERLQAIEKAREITDLVPSEAYRLKRLARVRAQLALVDEQIETLIKSPKADQSRLKGLVEAQDRLSEQERKLDGRPLPGSHRPSRQKPSPRSTGTGPVDAE